MCHAVHPQDVAITSLTRPVFVLQPRGCAHIVRFIESFQQGMGADAWLWLVFRDEGTSLHSLMYSSRGSPAEQSRSQSHGGAKRTLDPVLSVMEPSSWWLALRRSREGNEVLRQLVKQMLMAVETVHAANATHRQGCNMSL